MHATRTRGRTSFASVRPGRAPPRRGRRVSARLVTALLLLAPAAAPAHAANGFLGEGAAHGVLASIERIAAPQWRQTLSRTAAGGDWACDSSGAADCPGPAWRAFLSGQADASLRARLQAVNLFVNQVRYREDSEAWGTGDYWATPEEFFGRGGDCEDYAIAKYFALRSLGVAAADLYLTVMRDEVQGNRHAVLVVETPAGPYVLDNRTDRILPWRSFEHYRTIYWVNEDRGWVALLGK